MEKTINGKKYIIEAGATLEGATLEKANLAEANLEGANLEGAKTTLCTVNFTGNEYEQAKQFIKGLR